MLKVHREKLQGVSEEQYDSRPEIRVCLHDLLRIHVEMLGNIAQSRSMQSNSTDLNLDC